MKKENNIHEFKLEEKSLWWVNEKPKYNEVDQYIGYNDAFDNPLFELDIIKYPSENKEKSGKGIVLWESSEDCFGVFDIYTKKFTPWHFVDLPLFKSSEIEIVGQLFDFPSLQEKLGLSDI